jgi:hypothetical protein
MGALVSLLATNYESYELSIGLRTVKADSYVIPIPFIDSFGQVCLIEDAAIPRRRKSELPAKTHVL